MLAKSLMMVSCMPVGLWLVIPAVPRLLLVLLLLGFEASQQLGGAGGRMPPVALAVLVQESHFGLGEELQQVLVAGSGGTRQAGGALRLDQHGMDGAAAEDAELHLGHRVLEVVLGGGAGVEAAVGELEGAQQQALLRPQHPALHPQLVVVGERRHSSAEWRPVPPRVPPAPPEQHPALTSFRRSLLSFCSSHLTLAWGERGWHSRKAVLPSTPYCTASTAFLLAAGVGHGQPSHARAPPVPLPRCPPAQPTGSPRENACPPPATGLPAPQPPSKCAPPLV